MKYYLAIDLGASSGRHVIGYLKDGEIILKEIYRFKTEMDETSDGLVWNIPRIFNEIKVGIKKAFEIYKEIESLYIVTWGVDYVLMNGDKEIPPYYAYRNQRNITSSKIVNDKIPFEELYKESGIQFASFNTIYQLFYDNQYGRLDNATDYLMLPSYFTYKLTGAKTHEYTNESTGALLNPFTKEYNLSLIDRLKLPRKLFKNIAKPGLIVGDLLPGIQKEVGGNTKVVLCASHDTASAFESVEVPEDGVILSSGTWSLLGIKLNNPIINEQSLNANYTNEGGVGYIRFLKNIMGMWIVNKTLESSPHTLEQILESVDKVTYKVTFDANSPKLLAPVNMKSTIMDMLKVCPPQNDFELFQSIFRSLAITYKNAIEELETITQKHYSKIYVLGGGAKNNYLNSLIEEYTNKKVIALPIEATSLGNIKIQMKASKEL